MTLRRLVLALALSLLLPASALAQSDDADHAAALALVQTGVQAAQAGDWESAREAFARAFSLVTSTRVLMNLAGAQRHTGHLRDAAESYRQWRTLATERDEPFRAEVDDALSQLEREIPQVRVLVDGLAPGDEIDLDGAPIAQEEAIPLDPGAHVVSVTRGARVLQTQSFELAAGERRAVTLEVPAPVTEPVPPPARSIFTERPAESLWDSPWIWVGIGAGAAIILGLVIGIAVAASSGGGSSTPDMGTLGPFHL